LSHSPAAETRQISLVRDTLWFATAYTIVILVHEAAHALVARAVGIDVTMFQFWVNFDSQNLTVGQRAASGIAGPASSLALGLAAWLAYRRTRGSPIALPLLYVAAHGVSNFFGNLMSAAFVGDFSNVSIWLGLPMGVRYAASLIGAMVVMAVLFTAGRELRRRLSWQLSRTAASFVAVIVPAAVGTAIIIVINQPAAIPGFAAARAGEAGVWLFAAAGAFTAKPSPPGEQLHERLRWADGATALAVLAVVRLLVQGVQMH
jgi:hypothetical protein